MHHRSKSSHHTQPKFYTHIGRTELKTSGFSKRPQQLAAIEATLDGLTPEDRALVAEALSKTNARGDDDDSRQIIADLISDDRSPFTPDDEMALRHMSAKALGEMARKYLKANSRANSHTRAVANASGPAIKAMSSVGPAGADFHMRANERKRMSDAYIARNPLQRSSRVAPVTNSNDEAVRAMTEHSGGSIATILAKKGK